MKIQKTWMVLALGVIVTIGAYSQQVNAKEEARGENNFAQLMAKYSEGAPANTPWVSYHWPYISNGIASGKFGPASPAGKYDAARGTRQAQEWEVKHHGSAVPRVQGWWGHDSGWAVAAALYPEPKVAAKVNGIVFEPIEIKALLSEAAMSASADFYGTRLDPWTRDYEASLSDVAPGQLFLVLTNYMGKLKNPVIMDRFTGDQVWNVPIAGYRFNQPSSSDYLGQDPKSPGRYLMNVHLKVWWTIDHLPAYYDSTPDFNFEENPFFESQNLTMQLWLDGPAVFDGAGRLISSGNVVVSRMGDYFASGSWMEGPLSYVDGHPDFVWVPYGVTDPDPSEDYGNPYISIDWIKKHLLVPGGVDDPSVVPAPFPEPAPSPLPRPTSTTSPRPSGSPIPFPTFTTSPRPIGSSSPIPFPTFTSAPSPSPSSALTRN